MSQLHRFFSRWGRRSSAPVVPGAPVAPAPAAPPRPTGPVAEARALWAAGRAVEGMKLLAQVAQTTPDLPELNFVYGLCLERVGQHTKAVSAYARELALNPHHAEARAHHEALTQALSRRLPRQIPPLARSWHTSLPREVLLRIQNALHNYHYRGIEMLKNPFDLALYPMLLWQTRPRTIIEIGSKSGGSGLWFGDLLTNFGINGHIWSADIVPVTNVSHSRVTFLEGNGRALAGAFPDDLLKQLPRPWLVIEDADHEYETTIAVLNFFHRWLEPGEYLVVEDGIISDLSQLPEGGSGPHRALREFLTAHPEEYEVDGNYCDFFGDNVTWCTNGFLRRVTPALLRAQREARVADCRQLIAAGRWDEAFVHLNDLKAGSPPVRDVDHLRALCFQHRQELDAAREALKEELRYFPDNEPARMLLTTLSVRRAEPDDPEFRELLTVIRPYTMVGEARLRSLYTLAKRVCAQDLPGNFVECGVAAGGSAALLAAVIARHSRRPRKLFCFDTFAGMPAPSEKDVHAGQPAPLTGWGAGTCAAPERSLREVCRQLGVEHVIEPVQGLFADTLPAHRERIGTIALLHLDGDWYSSTRDILTNLFDQLTPGAVMQFDDYGYWEGCQQAAAEFAQERGLRWDLRDIDGTGVWTTR